MGERCKDSGFQLAQHRDGAVLIGGEFFFGKAEVSFVTGIVRKLPGKTSIGKAVSVFRFQIRYEMTVHDMHACVYLYYLSMQPHMIRYLPFYNMIVLYTGFTVIFVQKTQNHMRFENVSARISFCRFCWVICHGLPR